MKTAAYVARTLAIAALLGAAAGCLSKAPPEPIRHIRIPDAPAPAAAAAAGAKLAAHEAPRPLRLRRIEAASHLDVRVARRTSDVDVAFLELVRWTDPPAAFVERALARELFEARAFARSEAPSAPRLDVTVLAFEEVLAPRRAAAVALRATLFAEGAALERTFAAEASVAGDDPAELARAMGRALAEAARALARDVEARLRAAR